MADMSEDDRKFTNALKSWIHRNLAHITDYLYVFTVA